MRRFPAAPPAAAALLLLASVPPGDRPAFRPAAGATVRKAFDVGAHAVLDDLEVLIDGLPQDGAIVEFEREPEATARYELEVTDTLHAVGGGRPLDLERAFGALRLSLRRADDEPTVLGADELLGETVRFRWDAGTGSYSRASEAELPAGLLAVLGEDTDLRVVLPDEEVEPGATWERAGAALAALLLPGLDLDAAFVRRAGPFADLPAEVAADVARAVASTSATFTYEGTREVDGTPLAAIAVEWPLAVAAQLDPALFEATSSAGEDPSMEATLFEADLEFDVEGRVLWDPAAGRFHSLELTGAGSLLLTVHVTLDAPGREMLVEGTADLGVELTARGTAESR